MDAGRVHEYLETYRDGLLNDTLPFWIPRAIDRRCGGYLTCLDRDGRVLQTDKPVWVHGRFAWLLATLYNTVEKNPQWLELSRHGIDFLNRHCFDSDGRMYFSVTREGRPLRKRRYLFSECFAAVALAAYGLASGEEAFTRQAMDIFRMVLRYHRTPGLCAAKTNPDVRPMKGLAMPMILIVTAQELRKASDDPLCGQVIEESIDEIRRDFLKKEFRCLLETVGPKGEFIDDFDGRMINPGHSIEAGWFILREARLRGDDAELVRLGTTIIDWSLELGWDNQFGGLLYYRDARGLSPTEYWQDMKFWWPHNEAIIATLLAHQATGQAKYEQWHRRVHDWTYAHFPDREHGEWYGYLRRDGQVATPLKGNMWKGPFHLPRMQWYCWKLLEGVTL